MRAPSYGTAVQPLLKILRSPPGGVRLRATVAATLTVAVALGLASAALIAVLQGSLESSARAEAAGKAKAVAATVRIGMPGQPAPILPPPGSAAGSLSPFDVQVVGGAGEGHVWKTGGGYVVSGEQVPTNAGKPLVIQARSSLAPTQQAIASLRNLLVPGIPALLLLVALLTWSAVGRALKPVSAIRVKMADVTAHDLQQRVPEPDSHDEIAALARTVNATLDRLQTAAEQHKRFIADAAHELRSPLAILRTRLELAAFHQHATDPGPEPVPESADPCTHAQELATQALTDVGRLQSLSADLLLLARLDAGEPLRDQEVDLGQVAAEEAAQTRPRSEVQVGLRITADVLVRGSSDQLRRLVANLVDNAVRHATSTVTVRLSPQGPHAILEVTDDGPGIPEQHRDTVFDRFTRLDQARNRDDGGSGLGLAIARDITTAHGGTLTVMPTRHAEPGACLRAVLPIHNPLDADPGLARRGTREQPKQRVQRLC
ncbi:MAG TPA: HAMP domain-containing sensor histidine kinase [Streptosporangiaceae bacterium]|nr:HAMP domain-containing sensor histidine kinase [Streptosporangiaceae bacterium]